MNRVRFSTVLIAILVLVGTLSVTLIPVLTGSSAMRKDVHWIKDADPGRGLWKAFVWETSNGVIYQQRYEWNGEEINVLVKYYPLAEFPNEPHGKNVLRWPYNPGIYLDQTGDEADLADYFTEGTEYWVKPNHMLF